MIQKRTQIPQKAEHSTQQITTRIKRHQRRLYIVGLLAVLLTGGFFFFKRYQHQQNEIAQSEMFQAVYHFEQGQFGEALYGNSTCVGLLDIVKEYRFTKAARLAHFYAGICYMHQKDYDEAIKHLASFRAKDPLLKTRAWALMGDAFIEKTAHKGAAYAIEQGTYKAAAYRYEQAAYCKDSKIFTPIYCARAALAYEARGSVRLALRCYQRIVREFPDSMQYGAAVKHIARLETLQKQPGYRSDPMVD